MDENVDTSAGLTSVVDAVQEERAHYSYVVSQLKAMQATLPAISANDSIRQRMNELQLVVEGWNKSLRALEVRLNLPDS